jgi:hypothetical protein
MATKSLSVRDLLAHEWPRDRIRSMGTEPERLWTEREFSDFFGRVSLRTLRRWRQEGSGPAYVKVGRKVMYRPSDVQTWLDELRIESEKDDRRTASDRRDRAPGRRPAGAVRDETTGRYRRR